MTLLRLSVALLAASAWMLRGHAAPASRVDPSAHVALADRATSPLDLLSDISSCALSCLLEHSPAFGCSVVDVECQCHNEPLYETLSTCMVNNCTLEEAIGLAKVDAKQCHRPTDSLNSQFKLVYWLFSVFIYGPYGLRIISRGFITKQLWWDDFFHTVAIIVTTPLTYGVGELGRLGFGNHLFQVQASNLQTFWFWYFTSQVLWAANIMALKISVLCLYLRLFPNRPFLIACAGVLAVMVVGGLTFLLLDVLQCQPVAAGWTLQHGDDAKCLSFSVIAVGGGVFNVLSELAIFVLPMPILLRLNVQLKKKIEIVILLGLGVITIIVGSTRIPYLLTLDGRYADLTYRSYPAFLWTALELLVAHLCVSAPAVSVVFKTVHRSLTSAVRSVSGSARDKVQSDQSHGSSARGLPAAARPRPPLSPRGGEESDGDEVELRPTTGSSRLEAHTPGAEWNGGAYR